MALSRFKESNLALVPVFDANLKATFGLSRELLKLGGGLRIRVRRGLK